MRELKFICVQPDDTYYLWQTHLWLESLKKLGHSDKAIVMVYIPLQRNFNTKWKEVEALYPEAEFFYLKDEDNINNLFSIYIPILRPYTLFKYFKLHPEMVNKAIFYCDNDVIFTEKFNIDAFIEDETCYMSDTKSYISASYFDSKVKDVLPAKLEDYKKIDVLAETASIVGISRDTCVANDDNSGGAQYLLKNIDANFWKKVFSDTINIRTYLLSINRNFFESEDKGFQSWCADMWAVLWNLWLRQQETKVVKELDFAWSPDQLTKLDTCTIFHNAGITSPTMSDVPVFYKGAYHAGNSPFADPHLQEVLNDDRAKKLCNHYYVQQLIELKKKYNLNY